MSPLTQLTADSLKPQRKACWAVSQRLFSQFLLAHANTTSQIQKASFQWLQLLQSYQQQSLFGNGAEQGGSRCPPTTQEAPSCFVSIAVDNIAQGFWLLIVLSLQLPDLQTTHTTVDE